MAPAKSAKTPAASAKKPNRRHHNNRDLGHGVVKYSRSAQYQRKGLFRLKTTKPKKVAVPKVSIKVVKKIGGAKNGGERAVMLRKNKANLPTIASIRPRPTRNYFKKHVRYTRKNLTPGRILILLAGRHQGKRVVLLKVSYLPILFLSPLFIISLIRCHGLRSQQWRQYHLPSMLITVSATKITAELVSE